MKKISPIESKGVAGYFRTGGPFNEISGEVFLMINFSQLSDDQIEKEALRAVGEETKAQTYVLQVLAEVERRRIYSKTCPSLFEYCVKVLKYSAGSAQRRIDTMRAMKLIPEIESKLISGELNLTSVSQAQQFWRREAKAEKPYSLSEKRELLEKLENKSTRECIETLIEISPESVPQDRRRVLTTEKIEVRVVIGRALQEKLDRIKALMSHKHPRLSDSELLEEMADIVLDKIDPLKKRPSQAPTSATLLENQISKSTRNSPPEGASQHPTSVILSKSQILKSTQQLPSEGASPRQVSATLPKPTRNSPPEGPSQVSTSVILSKNQTSKLTQHSLPALEVDAKARQKVRQSGGKEKSANRYIPAALRRQVWARDQGRCTQPGCETRHFLEIDHIRPLAKGGTTELTNLRLLCRAHNQRAAIETLGFERMTRFLDGIRL